MDAWIGWMAEWIDVCMHVQCMSWMNSSFHPPICQTRHSYMYILLSRIIKKQHFPLRDYYCNIISIKVTLGNGINNNH